MSQWSLHSSTSDLNGLMFVLVLKFVNVVHWRSFLTKRNPASKTVWACRTKVMGKVALEVKFYHNLFSLTLLSPMVWYR